MSRYRVLRDCHWNFGYWDEGRIVEIDDELNPPEHFKKLGRYGEEVDTAPEVRQPGQPDMKTTPATMKELNDQKKSQIPKTGMGSDTAEPKLPGKRK